MANDSDKTIEAPPLTVPLVNPRTGKIVSVDPVEAGLLKQGGYVEQTPEMAAKAEENKKFETPGQQLAAAAEAAASGITLSGSHYLEQALGVPKEDILKRQEHWPTTSTIAELGGIAAGAFASGGESLAARVAAAPLETVGTAGKVLGGVTRKLLSGIPGAAGETIARYGAGAANLAGQAEIFNLISKVDESHLSGGNLQQGVENAMASAGPALAMSAALFGVGHVAGKAISIAAQKATDAVGDVVKWLVPRATNTAADVYAKASQIATGEEAATYAKYTGPQGAIGREELRTAAPRKTVEQLAKDKDQWERVMQPQTQKFIEQNDELAQKLLDTYHQDKASLLSRVDELKASHNAVEVSDMLHKLDVELSENELTANTSYHKNLKAISNQYVADLNALQEEGVTSQKIYDTTDKLKNMLQFFAKVGEDVAPNDKLVASKLANAAFTVKSSLEDPAKWGKWGVMQQAINGPIADWIAITGKDGALTKRLTEFVKYEDGRATQEVKGTAITNLSNKLETNRSQDFLDAIQYAQKHSQGMIDAYKMITKEGAISRGVSIEDAQKLIDNADSSETMQKLFNAQQTSEAINQHLEAGEKAFGEMSKYRGLASFPWVSSMGPKPPTVTGVLTTGMPGLVTAPSRAVGRSLYDPVTSFQTLAKIDHYANKTVDAISRGVGDFFAGIENMSPEKADLLRKSIALEIGKSAGKDKKYAEQLKEITNEHGDPVASKAKYHAAMMRHEDTPSDVALFAPNFSKAVADKQAAVSQHVANLFPKVQTQYPGFNAPGKTLYAPSKTDLMAYQRQIAIADKPLLAMKLLSLGQLTSADVDTLKTLWPTIYKQTCDEAIKAATDQKEPLTIKQKNQLSILLGQPIADYQDPGLKQLVQQNWAAQSQKKKAAQQSAQKGMTKMASEYQSKTDKLVEAK